MGLWGYAWDRHRDYRAQHPYVSSRHTNKAEAEKAEARMGSFDQRRSGEVVESKVLGGCGWHPMDNQYSPSSEERWNGQNVHGL